MKEYIKNILKRLLRPIYRIEKSQLELLDLLYKLQNELRTSIQQTYNLIDKTIYYKVHWEKIFTNDFYAYYKREDFFEKYAQLVKGLDSESIRIIQNIIRKQKAIEQIDISSENPDIFTEYEQKTLKVLAEEFYPNIIQITQDVYTYDKYFLPCHEFDVGVIYYKHCVNELKNLIEINSKAIIDVGAYIGDSLLILSEMTKDKVYSFEAGSNNFELMKKTVELNKITNAVLIPKALGKESGKITLNLNGNGSTICESKNFLDALLGRHQFFEEVDVITLDEYVEQNNINVGLIKIDIEGAEQDFLAGAMNTIKRDKPSLIISIYHNPLDFFEIKPLIESWNLGYKIRIVKPIDGYIIIDTMIIAEV